MVLFLNVYDMGVERGVERGVRRDKDSREWVEYGDGDKEGGWH